MEPRQWMPGTMLTVPSDIPPFIHYLMVEYFDFHTGQQMVIHSMPETGVARAVLDDVIKNKPVTVFWVPPTPAAAELVIGRMQSKLGTPYDAAAANCEHPIRWAITGQWESKQASAVGGAILLGGAVAFFASL